MSLAQFLSSVSSTTGGKYGQIGRVENGVRPFGAYGILMENWDAWAASAGLRGVDKFDPAAQDAVAAHMAQVLFQRYGDWTTVAAAWYAGAENTDRAMQSGEGLQFLKNKSTQSFLTAFTANFEKSEGAQLPKQAQKWANPQGAPKGWLSPVAGDSEYSGGSWMPGTKTHRGRTHAAMDVYAKRGTPIVAPVGGRIVSVKTGKVGGHTVRMRGDDGLMYYFAHMDSKSSAKNGSTVRPGAHLGFVGNSGSAKNTKPHLHFSIKKGGTALNPKTYLDGAKNSQNYYRPAGAEHPVSGGGEEGVDQKFDGFLTSVSNRVAGGQRMDYRQIGLPPENVGMPTEEADLRDPNAGSLVT